MIYQFNKILFIFVKLKDKNAETIENQMIKVPKTQVRIGKSYDFPSYGWDNEYGQIDCV
jgi:hypothetical protein